MNTELLHAALIAAAVGQTLIALLNFALPRIMRWRGDLERLPLLIREVFYVHAWFISLTLLLFAALTFRFPGELTATALGRWLAGGIAIFWAVRAGIQIGYYSSSHWRGSPLRFRLHLILVAVYGGFAVVYGAASFGG